MSKKTTYIIFILVLLLACFSAYDLFGRKNISNNGNTINAVGTNIQSTGEQFRLKETRENPSSLFDCVETYQPEITESPATMSELSAQLQSLLLKASQIEQQINQQMEG